MMLTNETLRLLPVRSFLDDDKRIRCLVSTRHRLQTHFFVTTLVHMFFACMYIPLLFFSTGLFIVSPRFRHFIRMVKSNIRLQSYAPERRYFYGIVLFIKEVALLFVYTLFAFLYQWFGLANNDYWLTSLNIRRWFVEGSFAPFLLGAFLIEYYIGRSNIVFDEYQLYFVLGMTLKVPLFVVMRCAESQPDFFLNRFASSLHSQLCSLLPK